MDVKPGYKQTEAGVIPNSWPLAELQHVCREPVTYGIVQCGPHVENGIPYIRVSDMTSQELDVSGMLRTSQEIAARFVRSTVKEGDIVYALRGKIGEVRQVGPTVAGANLTQGTARLSPNDRLRTGYLLWALRSPQLLRQSELGAKGSTFREITLADLRRIKLPIPSQAEQEAIAQTLSDTDSLIESLGQLLAKKLHVKRGLMQGLLTGKKRLPGFTKKWEVVNLDCVADRITGFWGANSYSSDRPRCIDIIRSGDISPEGLLTGSAQRFLSDLELSKAHCNLDDVVITTSGNGLGKVWWCDGRPNVAASNFVRILRPLRGKAHGRYLSYAIRSEAGLKQLEAHTATSAYPNLRPSFFTAAWISLPPVSEQAAIAVILSDMDSEITALETKLAKARQLKQGMMQELLTGRIRLV